MNKSLEKQIIYNSDEVDKMSKDEIHLIFNVIKFFQKFNCCFCYKKKEKSFKAINIEYKGIHDFMLYFTLKKIDLI